LFSRKNFLTAFLSISISFLLKWIALVVLPFFSFYLLIKRKYLLLIKCLAVSLLIILLPYLLLGSEKYLAPFKFQSNRELTGESIFGLFEHRISPKIFIKQSNYHPWAEIPSPILTKDYLFKFLFLGMLILFLIFIKKNHSDKNNILSSTLFYSSLAIPLFIGLNRSYSPQFIWWWTSGIFLSWRYTTSDFSTQEIFVQKISLIFVLLLVAGFSCHLLSYKYIVFWPTLRFYFWIIYGIIILWTIAVNNFLKHKLIEKPLV
jgi:hypothetical protein